MIRALVRMSCLEIQNLRVQLVATWLLQSLTPLCVGFPFSLGPERFIVTRLVSSPTPCIACATQMTVKSVGSEEELGCGVVSEGGVRNKWRHLGKKNMRNQERVLSIQLKQSVFL